jgi:hypothetical protein
MHGRLKPNEQALCNSDETNSEHELGIAGQ